MQALIQAIPDVEALLSLEPEELGGKLLFLLRKDLEREPGKLLHLQHVNSSQLFDNHHNPALVYPRASQPEVELALMEAWNWLEVQGLLIRASGTNGNSGFRVLSRRAKKFENAEHFVRYEVGRRLPRGMLHVRLSQTVWMAFLRGEFDSAVLQAMKAVEVAVREAAGLPASAIGVKLMHEAFAPAKGKLTDVDAEPSEQMARMALFAGAIGSYKNPQSHRDVNLDNPEEAVELIMLANHLLRIVDARSGSRD